MMLVWKEEKSPMAQTITYYTLYNDDEKLGELGVSVTEYWIYIGDEMDRTGNKRGRTVSMLKQELLDALMDYYYKKISALSYDL